MKLPTQLTSCAVALLMQAVAAQAAGAHELWLEFDTGGFNSRTNDMFRSSTTALIIPSGAVVNTHIETGLGSFYLTPSYLSVFIHQTTKDEEYRVGCAVEYYHSIEIRNSEQYYGRCSDNARPFELIRLGEEKAISGAMRPCTITGGTTSSAYFENGVQLSAFSGPSPRLGTTESKFLRSVQGHEHQNSHFEHTVHFGDYIENSTGVSHDEFNAATHQRVLRETPGTQYELGFWMHHPTTELGLPTSTQHPADAMCSIPTVGLPSTGVRVNAATTGTSPDNMTFSKLEYLSWSNVGGAAE